MWTMSTQWSNSATHVSLLLTSSLMDPSTFKCGMSFDSSCCLFFVGCNHVTAWLILMSAHIFPASCLHFRTSLRSITANRWVHLQYSRYTVWNFCRPSWIYVMSYSATSSYLMCIQQNVQPFVRSQTPLLVCRVCMYSWMCDCFQLFCTVFSRIWDFRVIFIVACVGDCK